MLAKELTDIKMENFDGLLSSVSIKFTNGFPVNKLHYTLYIYSRFMHADVEHV